ncbi:hypothetical protein GCM10011329_33560 [Stakelama pacifica]|nr:hypothetical protein GCM10011329_33560 [Stakelama pacifica]
MATDTLVLVNPGTAWLNINIQSCGASAITTKLIATPASETSRTGRRPNRSLRAPSTGANTNRIERGRPSTNSSGRADRRTRTAPRRWRCAFLPFQWVAITR